MSAFTDGAIGATAALVAWSAFDTARRSVKRHRLSRERRRLRMLGEATRRPPVVRPPR